MTAWPEFLDDEARAILSRLETCRNPHDLLRWRREVSQWVEHGRVSGPMREKMLKALQEVEDGIAFGG